jgi:hypothetical protein
MYSAAFEILVNWRPASVTAQFQACPQAMRQARGGISDGYNAAR